MSVILKALATWGDCYKTGRKMPGGKPRGIVVHSTGCNNPYLKRYVNLPSVCGENIYKNYFGNDGSDVNPHAVIGKDKNGAVKCVQILPFDICCWGCGHGAKGSYNYDPAFIQFEICEDGLNDKAYFEAAFDMAAKFCAELMERYPTISINDVVSHKEAAARGFASNHGDPENWLSKFGENMNRFRDKVKAYAKPASAAKPSSSGGSSTKKFIPRTSAPSASDKYWKYASYGGLNECIHIGGGSVLPNCVGYAWGRFYELTGTRPKLSKGNAENWYANTADGYKRSQTPTLGAVACWRKGQAFNESDGCGHVAVVEEIKANGDIVVSQSAYGGSRFYVSTYSKANGYSQGALVFQGFILPPVQFKSGAAASANEPTVSAAFKVGDIVEFTGSTHYAGSTAARGTSCKPGKAKITRIASGAHPYHLVNDGSGSTVYGWVNAGDVQTVTKKSIDEIVMEVIRGDWGNGDDRVRRLTAAGYDYKIIQAGVDLANK